MKKTLTLLILVLSNIFLFAQENTTHSVSYDNVPLKSVLDDTEYRYAIDFIYTTGVVNTTMITLSLKKRNLQQILNDISKASNLKFTRIDNTHFYISKLDIILIQDDIVSKYLTKGIHKNLDGSYAINPKKIGILPGLIEPDVLESLQQFPTVISINETAADINVRGGRTDQNNVIWDDMDMYLTGHLFGMISAFNPYIADNVNFYDKGTNAKYGEKISSTTTIQTSDKITDKTKFQFGISAISADAILNTPVVKNKLDIQLSYRHSYEHLFETPTFKNYEDKAFQYTTIQDEEFNFNDYNAKINFKLNKNNSFHFSTIHIDNDLENVRSDDTKILNDVLDIESNGYSAKWLKKWSDKTNQKTGFSVSEYSLFYNLEIIHSPTFSSYLNKVNNINNFKVFTDIDIHFKQGGLLNFGYQYKKQDVDFKIESIKDITYILDQDDASVETHSIYSGLTFQKTLNYFVYFGVRSNYYKSFDLYKFEPRFIANKNLNQFYKIQISGEIKNQIISQIDETLLGNYSIDNKLWRLANNEEFPILNSKHISTELTYAKDKWNLETSFYYKEIDGIYSLSLGYLNPDDNSFHSGNEIVKGASLHIDRNFGKINTWINYSFNDIKNRFDNILNYSYFTADTEIQHALNTAVSYKHKGLQIALNWKYRTGKPITVLQYHGAVAYVASINSENLPDFHRMDLSSTYKFSFNKKINALVGLSIRNVYDNQNLIARVYTGNNTINDPIAYKDYKAIGITPNFMFRIFF